MLLGNLEIFERFSHKKLMYPPQKKNYSEVLAQSQLVPTQRTVRIFSSGFWDNLYCLSLTAG